MEYPLITVGLICFNAGKTLAAAIDCIREQTWPNLEIVVVDDVSTDGTWSALENFAKTDSRVRIFRNDINSGAGTSRHRVVNEAKGDFVVFFDDDDISDPERIAKQHERIVSYENAFHPNVPVICHVSRKVRDEAGHEWYFQALGTTKGEAPHGNPLVNCLLLGKKTPETCGNIGTCMLMARTEAYHAIGNFDPEFRRAQDTDIVIRWARAGAHFVGLSEPLVTQRLTVTTRKVDLEKKFVLRYLEKNRDYLENSGAYRFIILWTLAKYAILSGNKIRGAFFIAKAFLQAPVLTVQHGINALSLRKFNKMVSSRYASGGNPILPQSRG